LLLGLQAGVQNLPFIPVFGFLGSDYLNIRPDLKMVKDPYTDVEYVVVPSIMPDVAVIHATKGDRSGGVTTLSARNDRLLAMASRKTIAVVEALVAPDEVLPGLHEVYIAPVHIDAVVLAPGGAHPTSCPGRYAIDAAHMAAYVTAAKDEASFQEYLQTYILAPESHEAYLEKVGFNVHGK
jgi:glutaconate CoA-transferase, subunit A